MELVEAEVKRCEKHWLICGAKQGPRVCSSFSVEDHFSAILCNFWTPTAQQHLSRNVPKQCQPSPSMRNSAVHPDYSSQVVLLDSPGSSPGSIQLVALGSLVGPDSAASSPSIAGRPSTHGDGPSAWSRRRTSTQGTRHQPTARRRWRRSERLATTPCPPSWIATEVDFLWMVISDDVWWLKRKMLVAQCVSPWGAYATWIKYRRRKQFIQKYVGGIIYIYIYLYLFIYLFMECVWVYINDYKCISCRCAYIIYTVGVAKALKTNETQS